jgi:PIN domain nuclease of toxin-antitoxin system
VTLLDAYALIAFLVGGPAAGRVRAVLREGDAAVATANLVEVLDVSNRIYGLPIGRVMEIVDPLLDDVLNVVVLDRAIARRAAELRAEHYHRTTRPISLADAILVASARAADRIATADLDVLAVADREGIATIALSPQQ